MYQCSNKHIHISHNIRHSYSLSKAYYMSYYYYHCFIIYYYCGTNTFLKGEKILDEEVMGLQLYDSL